MSLPNAKQFPLPNYAQVLILSRSEHDWSSTLRNYVVPLDIAPVDQALLAQAYTQMIDEHGHAGLLESYKVRAEKLTGNFKVQMVSESQALNIYHSSTLLRFLMEQLNHNHYAGKSVSTDDFWRDFDAHLKANHDGKSYNRVSIGREIKQFIPGLKKAKLNTASSVPPPFTAADAWKPAYQFPSLEECQQSINEKLGYQWPWPSKKELPASTSHYLNNVESIENIEAALDDLTLKALPDLAQEPEQPQDQAQAA